MLVKILFAQPAPPPPPPPPPAPSLCSPTHTAGSHASTTSANTVKSGQRVADKHERTITMYEILIGGDPRAVFTELKTEQEALDLIKSTLLATDMPVTIRRSDGAIVALIYNDALYRPACDMQEEAQP